MSGDHSVQLPCCVPVKARSKGKKGWEANPGADQAISSATASTADAVRTAAADTLTNGGWWSFTTFSGWAVTGSGWIAATGTVVGTAAVSTDGGVGAVTTGAATGAMAAKTGGPASAVCTTGVAATRGAVVTVAVAVANEGATRAGAVGAACASTEAVAGPASGIAVTGVIDGLATAASTTRPLPTG